MSYYEIDKFLEKNNFNKNIKYGYYELLLNNYKIFIMFVSYLPLLYHCNITTNGKVIERCAYQNNLIKMTNKIRKYKLKELLNE